jgi:hypothetical protein
MQRDVNVSLKGWFEGNVIFVTKISQDSLPLTFRPKLPTYRDDALGSCLGCFGAGNLVDVEAGIAH